jgi:ATP-binding protein involved in chromosome partitioning
MPLREHADGGLPLVIEDPDDAAAVAIHQAARGLIAGAPPAPASLPVLEVIPASSPSAPANGTEAERKPAGMSLPMA